MSNQPPASPRDIAKFYAEVKTSDHFGTKHLNALNFLSQNIASYLSDYFILSRDLSTTLGEEFRRCYFDYSFVVVPIHKALESYLNAVLAMVFEYKISKSPQETIGHYLNFSDTEKSKKLDEIEKKYDLKLNRTEWLSRWSALSDQWKKNRNPLTHSDEERIGTLTQAEQVASSIIREINLSLRLFTTEFFDPMLARIKEQEDLKIEKEKKKREAALRVLKERASGIA